MVTLKFVVWSLTCLYLAGSAQSQFGFGLTSYLTSTIEGTLNTATSGLSTALATTTNGISNIASTGINLGSNISNGITGSLTDVVGNGLNLGGSLVSGITGGLSDVVTSGLSLSGLITTSGLSRISQAGGAIVGGLQNVSVTLRNGVTTTVGGITSRLYSSLGSLLSTLGSGLSFLTDNLFDGVAFVSDLVYTGILTGGSYLASGLYQGLFYVSDFVYTGLSYTAQTLIQGVSYLASGLYLGMSWIASSLYPLALALYDASYFLRYAASYVYSFIGSGLSAIGMFFADFAADIIIGFFRIFGRFITRFVAAATEGMIYAGVGSVIFLIYTFIAAIVYHLYWTTREAIIIVSTVVYQEVSSLLRLILQALSYLTGGLFDYVVEFFVDIASYVADGVVYVTSPFVQALVFSAMQATDMLLYILSFLQFW